MLFMLKINEFLNTYYEISLSILISNILLDNNKFDEFGIVVPFS